MRPNSLYVHFPFCESKCHYCDFYSIGRENIKESEPENFIRALREESSRWAEEITNPHWETIFFGGGTPTMTPAENARWALEPLLNSSTLAPGYEWTMEANPSSATVEQLRDYRALGVNRISMGVQSLNDEILKKMGRVHDGAEALRALERIFTAGFTEVSVDLLCGVPEQTLRDLHSYLDQLTAFPIRHLSCYLLTLPPHHWMAKAMPPEDQQIEQLLFIHQYMADKGFRHYETSNYAKPGSEARHNLAYWKRKSYLGLGPSAHSFDGEAQRRFKNFSSLTRYVKKPRSAEESSEFLTPAQVEIEEWMLALRLDEGIAVEKFDTPKRLKFKETYLNQGYFEIHPQDSARIRLSPKGMPLSDQLLTSFI